MSEGVQKTIIDAEAWKNILKKVAKILLIVVLVGFYVSATIVVLFPRFSAKVYNFMGLSRAEEYSLERVYEKSKDNADLYNLIVFEQSHKNYQKELNYINMLMVSDGYDEFCENLNKSALDSIGDKSLIAHMCNTNGYLVNQKIKCLFNLGIGTETFIYSNLNSNYLTENSYATFVNLVYDSNMTAEQKQEVITTLNETFEQTNSNLTVEDLFKERIADIMLEKVSATELVDKVLLEYALMENYKAGYLCNVIMENSIQAETYRTLYLSTSNDYYNLIK